MNDVDAEYQERYLDILRRSEPKILADDKDKIQDQLIQLGLRLADAEDRAVVRDTLNWITQVWPSKISYDVAKMIIEESGDTSLTSDMKARQRDAITKDLNGNVA